MKQVIIDDFIPCKNGEPVFSRCNGRELWVMLVEKAWAKLHKCYFNIVEGKAPMTLRDLTGAPSSEISISDEDSWDIIHNGDLKECIMTASASQEDQVTKLKDIGLDPNHSYAIVRVQEVTDDQG